MPAGALAVVHAGNHPSDVGWRAHRRLAHRRHPLGRRAAAAGDLRLLLLPGRRGRPPACAHRHQQGRHQPLALVAALLHPAVALPRHGGLLPLADLHLRLRLLGGEGPPSGQDPDPAARHPAEHPGARLHARAGAGDGGALSALLHRPRAGLGADDLHRPGLEHDLQPLPLPAHRAARAGRGRHHLPLHPLAAHLACRAAPRRPSAWSGTA